MNHQPDVGSPTAEVTRRPPLVAVLLFLSFVCNIAALLLPFVEIDAAGSDAWIYGLLGSVQMLWEADMVVLAAMVFTFSVIFPFAKIIALWWLWRLGVTTPRQHSWLAWVEKLGKWSLFDVFLVAIMVALTNKQWLISSQSLPGLTFFLIAVLLGMLAGEALSATVHRSQPQREAATHRRGPVILAILVAGAVLLAYSLFWPFIQIDDMRLTDRDYSLVGLVPALWENRSPVLAGSLAAFVIVMPVTNLLLIGFIILRWWNRTPAHGAVALADLVSRWSMLAVFAMSLGVFLAEGHRFLGTEPKGAVWALVAGLALAWAGQFILRRSWRQ